MNIFHKITLVNLKKNRMRTLVTIIGIILSAAMFTAVTTSAASLQRFLEDYYIYNDGSWYGAIFQLSNEEAEHVINESEVSGSVTLDQIGYAKLENCKDNYKPYLYVCGAPENITDLLAVHVTEGRMPQNSSELLLPEHLANNGGITYKIGDTLPLELGVRLDEDKNILSSRDSLLVEEDETTYNANDSVTLAETFQKTAEKTYTVVGFYERPSFENYSAPGYTALTASDRNSVTYHDVYFSLKNGKKLSGFLSRYDKYDQDLNYNLMRLYGYSGEGSFNRVIKSLSAILIAIIVFGSISLIYNAFSISVSERKKQFGLLSSIGATRRQLMKSILFEASYLCVLAIPLGILFGLLGIGVTFYFTGDMIAGFLASDTDISLGLHPSAAALILSAVIAFFTVLVSAYLPAKRALKVSAIDAIRQTGDIMISPRRVKTWKLTEKLFHFEGMIASKNYKRSRRKYRATVISLFLSVVLFISASSFCAYLTTSVGRIYTDNDYDITYSLPSAGEYTPDDFVAEISSVKGIKNTCYSTGTYVPMKIEEDSLSAEYLSYRQSQMLQENDSDMISITFLQDSVFRDFLKEHRLKEDDYFHTEKPLALLMDSLHIYDSAAGKYYDYPMFSGSKIPEISILPCPILENDVFDEEYSFPLAVGAKVSEIPEGCFAPGENSQLIYPFTMLPMVFSSLDDSVEYANIPDLPLESSLNAYVRIRCEDHQQAYNDIVEILDKNSHPTDNLYDISASAEGERAMLTVVNIFSCGFIILISLIAAANVFNTISTNIILRKREFAMLKSVGLAPGGFRKMMWFECILYGCKGLLYGLPVSIFITWLIYRSIANGLEMAFFIPWYSIVIAIGSVFAVVGATMIYSMHRLSKENTIDALKNENL